MPFRRLALWAALLLPIASVAADRVAQARPRAEPRIRARFEKAGVAYPPAQIYLRAFKREGLLELWAGAKGEPLKRVHSYPICAASGALGPKRMLGDSQVPEGFYEFDRFNPWSNYHLSLRVSYPNASDAKRGTPGRLGGDIYVHGNCASIGCIAIEDVPIEEVYLALLDTRAAGAKQLPIHIFPLKLDEEGWKGLRESAKDRPELVAFWEELVPVYRAFEESHRVPRVKIDRQTGRYDLLP
jgi:murein L,D-transpeptidase YafK